MRINATRPARALTLDLLPREIRSLMDSKNLDPYGEPIEVSPERVKQFVNAVGDTNRVHLDDAYAQLTIGSRAIVPGEMLFSMLAEFLLPLQLALYREGFVLRWRSGSCKFPKSVPVGSLVRAYVQIISPKVGEFGIELPFDYQIRTVSGATLAVVGVKSLLCTLSAHFD